MVSNYNKGFTLIEVMMVVAIIGITAAIAIPSYLHYLPHLRLKAAARDIATSLNMTRMKTVANNYKSGTVTFNAGSDSFTTSYVNVNNNVISDPSNSSDNKDWKDANSVDIWLGGGGTKYTLVPTLPSDNYKVTYSSYGTISNLNAANTEYAVYLKNNPFPTNGEEYRVRIYRLTGKIAVERWNGVNTWE